MSSGGEKEGNMIKEEIEEEMDMSYSASHVSDSSFASR